VRDQRPQPPKGAHEDVILFTVGGFRFAIAAYAVGEIRGTEGLRPYTAVPGSNRIGKVEFILERNGETYFVVDSAKHFSLIRSAALSAARVLILRKTCAAVLVDSTDRMTEITVLLALPQAFTGDERNWYRGLTILNDDVVPVVNQDAFLSKAEAAILKTERITGVAAV